MHFELDHFFVAAGNEDAGLDTLARAGFEEGPTRDHPGQGTASRGFFFVNAYLELIWLVDRTEAESPLIARTHLRERLDPDGSACPFGIGLRTGEGEAELPFATWEYTPPYLPEGMHIPVGLNSEDLTEPFLFILPWRKGPGWDRGAHPNGCRLVTGLSLVLPRRQAFSAELRAITGMGAAGIRHGQRYLMDVGLDDRKAGRSVDLRPEIPLRITW